MNKFFTCLCWLFVILWLFCGPVGAVEVGTRAPGFTLPSVQGEDVSLSDFAGQLVLLKMGTTWCPGCRALGEEIDTLASVLDERKVVVLDVFVQDTVPMIKSLLEGKDLYGRYHALLDDGSVHQGYSVYLIPRLLVVDENQVVRFDSAGQELSAAEIRGLIEKFSSEIKGGKQGPV